MTFRQVFGIATILAIALVGTALLAFAQTQRLGQEVTAANAIWYQLLAGALWACLGVSLVYSGWGIVQKRWEPLALAAVLSGVFSFFAILSIGSFTLFLTLGQIILAATYSRAQRSGPSPGE